MKASELRQKSKQELNRLHDKLASEQFSLRMQHGTGQLAKRHQLKSASR